MPTAATTAAPDGNSTHTAAAYIAAGRAAAARRVGPRAADLSPEFRSVGGTCCSQSDIAYLCYAKSSGACLPTDGSYNDGVVSACCREQQDAGGVCIPPPPPPEGTQPTAEGGVDVFRDSDQACWGFLLIPAVGAIPVLVCLVATSGPPPDQCRVDNDCPSGSACIEFEGGTRQCVERASAEAFRACPPPSVMVEGTCCAPEAIESGACKPFRLSECTGGKVKRGEFCVCPQGTTENRRTGACDKPPPVAGKQDTGCKPGFRRTAAGRCVSACTGGKIYDDGACRCPAGTRENARGTCAKPAAVATEKNDTACKPGFQRNAGGNCVQKVQSPGTGSGSRGGEKVNQPGGGGILGGGLLESGGGGGGGTTTPAGGRAPAIGGDGGAARTFRPR